MTTPAKTIITCGCGAHASRGDDPGDGGVDADAMRRFAMAHEKDVATYFGKSVAELAVHEIAMWVGLAGRLVEFQAFAATRQSCPSSRCTS